MHNCCGDPDDCARPCEQEAPPPVTKVICLRCRRPQTNRVAQVDASDEFFLGCIGCGYPYAVYAKAPAA